MDNNNKFEQFDLNGIKIDIIYDPKKLEEEKTTNIKSYDSKICDDNNKDNKDKKKKDIKGKSIIPFLEDASTQTEPSYLDDDESSDENNYDDHSYTNKKRKREGNDDK